MFIYSITITCKECVVYIKFSTYCYVFLKDLLLCFNVTFATTLIQNCTGSICLLLYISSSYFYRWSDLVVLKQPTYQPHVPLPESTLLK